MSLIELTLFGKVDKVHQAIRRLQAFEPPDGYILAYSGGKDSVCILRLAQMAGVKHDAIYNITSVDPPELVNFVKSTPNVKMEAARYDNGKRVTMWNLIPKKRMPPTRVARYCCEYLKERSHKGRITITGVRWAESANRKKRHGIANIWSHDHKVLNLDNSDDRRMVEQCYRTHKTLVNPIVDWSDTDVWEFIRTESIPYCGLYDCGHKRLGCIGCPISTNASTELDKYPKYKAAYIHAFDRMIEARKDAGLQIGSWANGEDVMEWWLHGKKKDMPLLGMMEDDEQ